MISYPVVFQSKTEASSGLGGSWPVIASTNTAECAVPREFGGSGAAFSPEDFFALAVANCFVATFKVYAQASRLSFGNVHVTCDLVVDRDESQQPVMKSCTLNIDIIDAEKPDRIRTIAEKALRCGFILNSVKTEVKPQLRIFSLGEKIL